MRPTTARELWGELVRLFPGFIAEHTARDMEESEREGADSPHSVMTPFAQYFGGARETISDDQLSALGGLLSEAVKADDDLENAVSTCFLEHLRQLGGYKRLVPFLSRRAKDKTRA